MKKFSKLPSALAIQRSLVITDAVFYNLDVAGQISPVLVVEHGIRGTQNVNTTKGSEKDIANIQRTESAKLDDDAVEMLVRFDIRAAPLSYAITMCSEPGGKEKDRDEALAFRRALGGFLERSSGEPMLDLSKRYARNILSGRWLWRNRTYAKSITIKTFLLEEDGPVLLAEQDALSTPLTHFDNPTQAELRLAKVLADGWEGIKDGGGHAIRVEANIDFGVKGSVEVFPSQNYVNNKERGFARSLYKHPLTEEVVLGTGLKACGYAALRDQKIGNAIRTIDTWYKSFSESRLVTPVEPMAANLEAGVFLRERKETAFEIMKNVDGLDPSSDEGQFLLAIVIRGGVFGESKKGTSNTDASV